MQLRLDGGNHLREIPSIERSSPAKESQISTRSLTHYNSFWEKTSGKSKESHKPIARGPSNADNGLVLISICSINYVQGAFPASSALCSAYSIHRLRDQLWSYPADMRTLRGCSGGEKRTTRGRWRAFRIVCKHPECCRTERNRKESYLFWRYAQIV